MKKLHIAALVTIMLSTAACANQNSADSEPASSLSRTEAESPQNTEEPPPPAAFPDTYYALVESYIDNAVFSPAEEERLEPLSDLFKGHYDITGRTAGDGMEYYLAVRRKDAPVYDDFSSLNLGYIDEQLYIGYYDRESEPITLYELAGYDLLDMPMGYDSLDCFCLGIYNSSAIQDYPGFLHAFSQKGRAILDFMKDRPELSFYKEGQPFVKFHYQNEDTIKFYSEPYPCYVALTEEEAEEVRRQIAASQPVAGIETSQEAGKYLMKNGEICSTGASLSIDGLSCSAWGNHEFSGYITVASEEDYEFQSLIYNEDIYDFIMDKVNHAVGMDYGNFDSNWFQTPLKSASIVFPEYMGNTMDGTSELRSQTVYSREKLDSLAALMNQAIRNGESGFSACPYTAAIDLIREDGERLRLYASVDSCDSISYEGRIGFQYGRQADLAAIFDEAMKYRLEE